VRLAPTDAQENPRAFLQGLVTNDMLGPLPAYAALLTPQGKVLADFIVWADGADLLLDGGRAGRDADEAAGDVQPAPRAGDHPR
jgi:glycine cleavage system aminomethyltransferase T